MSVPGLRVPQKILKNDLITGLVMSIVNVPGALANGLLAGVNPVYGVYSMIAGTSVAALFTSSVIMNVDSTSAHPSPQVTSWRLSRPMSSSDT